MNKKKIEFITNKYMEELKSLSNKEILDLEAQLNRKPVQLYIKCIDRLIGVGAEINYYNISSLIRIDIRIRNEIRKLFTSLEESIRTQYLDKQNFELDDINSYEKIFKMNLKKIIDDSCWTEQESNIFDKLRIIRNDLSHINYPIIFKRIQEYKQVLLTEIKKLKFIDKKIIENYLNRIIKINDLIDNGIFNLLIN